MEDYFRFRLKVSPNQVNTSPRFYRCLLQLSQTTGFADSSSYRTVLLLRLRGNGIEGVRNLKLNGVPEPRSEQALSVISAFYTSTTSTSFPLLRWLQGQFSPLSLYNKSDLNLRSSS